MDIYAVLFIIISIICIIILFWDKITSNDKPKFSTAVKPAEAVKKEPTMQEAEFAVRPFVDHLNEAIGDYAKYECVIRLKNETVSLLKKAYCEAPEDFKGFSYSINHRLWAYKQIASITLEELSTGKYHLRGTLKPEGHTLANLNRHCLKCAYSHKYISREELDQALKSLDEQIREVGTWA